MAAKPRDDHLPGPSPDLQIAFYYRLCALRSQYFSDALQAAVELLELAEMDAQLRSFVPRKALKRVASFGLRGERVFPVPCVLRQSPLLLGYYRLLYGLSQKEFYNKGRFGRFKRMEDVGEIPPTAERQLDALCTALCETGAKLVDGLDNLSPGIVNDLQLLTLGPQLRGSENTRIGERATREVYALIEELVAPAIHERTKRSIRLVNAAKRTILIEFASDPDVLVTEMYGDSSRQVLSIEVKGGGDASNIHNRLGEAEKSHLKAKRLGCTDLWTVLRVDLPIESARKASPTTTHFFHLDRILDRQSAQHSEFRSSLCLRLGLALE